MSTIEVYYFSGTGNSLAVAKDIATQLNATLLPVLPLMNQETIKTKAKTIGIVFPIYDFKAPPLIDTFIKKLPNLKNTYLFAVCTYGVRPLNTMKKLQKTIQSCDGALSGGFTVMMPHNGLGFKDIPQQKQQRMFDNWQNKCKTIVDYVKVKEQGTIERSTVAGKFIVAGLLIKMLPQLLPMLFQALTKGWKSLGFAADDTCNGCGICAQVCPVDNITMVDGKPQWSDKSISCFACLQWCPQEAIQIGKLTKKMKRYHHPQVKMKEIIEQKKGLCF